MKTKNKELIDNLDFKDFTKEDLKYLFQKIFYEDDYKAIPAFIAFDLDTNFRDSRVKDYSSIILNNNYTSSYFDYDIYENELEHDYEL